VELLGKVRDRSVGSSELLQNATPRGVRERGERSIKSGRRILNHMVQYITQAFAAGKGWPRRTMRPTISAERAHPWTAVHTLRLTCCVAHRDRPVASAVR